MGSRPETAGAEALPWRPLATIFIVIVVALAAFCGPRLIRRPFLASLIEERFCPGLGMECRVAGPIHLRLLPYPVIEAKALTVALRDRKIRLSAPRVVAELRVLPLILGRISVNHLDLSQAVIDIAAPPEGVRLFASADGAGAALVTAISAADLAGDRLTRISLDDSRLLLHFESATRDLAVEGLTGMAAWPQGGGELLAHFAGLVGGEVARLRVDGPDLADLTRTEGAPLSVKMIFGGNWLTYRGRLVQAPDLVAAGTLEALFPSMERVARPLRSLKWPSWLPDAPLHVSSQAFVTARGADFENAEFTVGRSRFAGGMSLRVTPDGRPSLSGTLATPLIELGALSFPRPEEVALPSFGRLPDLDLRMSARRVELGGRSIDAVATGIILAERRLDLTVTQSSGDDAGAKLHLVATPDEEGVAVKLQASSEKLDIGSFLSVLSIDAGLTGMGDVALSLDGRGEDLARLEHSLSGKVSLQMQKGALSVNWEGNPLMISGGSAPGDAASLSRRFSDASFTAVAERGVLALTEGRIGEGAARLLVGGKLDLAKHSLDLALGPAGETAAEPAWRLRVTGPWSAPKLWRDPPADR